MQVSFFPRDKQFWQYHLSVILLIEVVTLLTTFLWSVRVTLEVISSVIVIVLLTINALSFRYFYLRNDWKSLSIGKLTVLSFVYGTLTSLVVTAILVAITGPFYLPELIANQLEYKPDTNAIEAFIRFTYGHMLQQQLFICAWIFIYIAVTNSRRAKNAELNNLRLQNSLKEATLTSLANQLNPHFLFNTLNNIRFMVHENPQHADEMITSLSDILRYSLESSQKDKLRISEEVEIIDRYLDIIKVQFEDRVHIDIDIPEIIHDYFLPPMVLQMLIENAVKHGLNNIQHGGKLQVKTIVKKDELIFIVINNIPQDSKKTTVNTGIGLNNIKQRLLLLYGQNAHLNINKTDSQFEVMLTMPKETTA
jgi:sensor histidine kinase YesM